jgi:hypothetical protein
VSFIASLTSINSRILFNNLSFAVFYGTGRIYQPVIIIFNVAKNTIDEKYVRGINIIGILELISDFSD